MGDSEDEYDRKRRDKFRGERAEPNYRGVERPVRSRDDWQDREAWSRPRPRGEYRGAPRDRGYSPSVEPQSKRMRHDYYPPHEGYYNHYQPYHQPQHREPAPAPVAEGSQPPMMSFKAFLAAQDDNISDSEAVEKYNDYKLEFQRQQLNEFFVAHKDDEWFRLKYHPEDSVKRKEEQLNALKKRVGVFLELLDNGKLDNISVDCSRTDDLIKLLDTVVIKLEGGTEADLGVLDETPDVTSETEKKEEIKVEKLEKVEKNEKTERVEKDEKEERNEKEDKNEKEEIVIEEKEKSEEPIEDKNVDQIDEESQKSDDVKSTKDNEDLDGEIKDDSKSDDKLEDISKDNDEVLDISKDKKEDDEKMDTEPIEEPVDSTKKDTENDVEKVIEEDKIEENGVEKVPEAPIEPEEPKSIKESKRRKRSSFSGSESSSSSDSESEREVETEKKPEENEESAKEDGEKDDHEDGEEEEPEKKSEDKVETPEEPAKPEPPRALHKTTSIFLRNLAPTITRQEVEAMCSRYSGFLRVALADPQPERRWLRRGWVTFTRNANIKEICWNLNNIRLRDCELGAIVNRDLSRRIRQVNGITAHKQVVRSDIRISAKVALHLDGKASLWADENNPKPNQEQSFGLDSNNPVLKNITDYLIEEASAEEEELLGLESSTEQQDTSSCTVERDDTLIKVLDKIILYLRVVHSVDYYNHCEYPNEDEMPNRCGILHARGPPPLTKTDITAFMGSAVEGKMSHFLPDKTVASTGGSGDSKTDKLVQLALKDEQAELDKFVVANTRELAKDKWLCPLSGKKFKGPDFVRKHIFNKHAEKVEEVKKEVQFFNNYLKDPKRPMLAEQQPVKREETPSYGGHPVYGSLYGYGGIPRGGYYNQGYGQRSRGYARARGGSDFRPVVHYRDLDAPREPEEFI